MMPQPISPIELRAERLARRLVDEYGGTPAMDIACARFARRTNSQAVFALWLAVVRHVGQLLKESGQFSVEALASAVGPIPEFGERSADRPKPVN